MAMNFWSAIRRILKKLFKWVFGRTRHNKHIAYSVTRHDDNPVMSPREEFDWESKCVFNPAAIVDDNGTVHLLYRAMGTDGISRIGYASSKDGYSFEERLPYPVYSLRKTRENIPITERYFNPKIYPSGGSWGGCEDPRLVRIEGKVYLSFNAFDNWDYIRIGVASIDEEDFFEKKWFWKGPFFVSPKGQVNKNWVLFPEKIRGKFAILHSITPKVQVDYIDRLEDLDSGKLEIRSIWDQQPNKNHWDRKLRGVGAPPLKTSRGWLVFYHAHEKNDERYKLGAMLLDLKNPKKIVARATGPLLSPDMWYENDWKPGIVYVCGSLIKDGKLFVYYGGGDKYVCLATAPIDTFLKELLRGKTFSLLSHRPFRPTET